MSRRVFFESILSFFALPPWIAFIASAWRHDLKEGRRRGWDVPVHEHVAGRVLRISPATAYSRE